MRAADYAWVGIAVGVAAYELSAAMTEWELLSEAADRYRQRHPVATYAAIVYLAGHLARLWPRRIDPLSILTAHAARATR